MKYKFNESQRKWIDRLKSGKTKKAIGTLEEDGGYRCCLGEAVFCLLDKFPQNSPIVNDQLEEGYENVMEELCLKGGEGEVDVNRISEKWITRLNKQHNINTNNNFHLTLLNDGGTANKKRFKKDEMITPLSHKEIGHFIEENPEAVFLS